MGKIEACEGSYNAPLHALTTLLPVRKRRFAPFLHEKDTSSNFPRPSQTDSVNPNLVNQNFPSSAVFSSLMTNYIVLSRKFCATCRTLSPYTRVLVFGRPYPVSLPNMTFLFFLIFRPFPWAIPFGTFSMLAHMRPIQQANKSGR